MGKFDLVIWNKLAGTNRKRAIFWNWLTKQNFNLNNQDLIFELSSFKSFNTKEKLIEWLKCHLSDVQSSIRIVLAGGDGTIHFVINGLMVLNEIERKKIILGTVGIGSSNDFHKPFNRYLDEKSLSIPCHLDFRNITQCDLGLVKLPNGENKYFVTNSSVGICAQGNHFFNSFSLSRIIGAKLCSWIYGIYLVFVRTPNEIHINHIDHSGVFRILNLNIIKRPYIAGSFKYPFFPKIDDGQFYIYLFKNMNVLEKIRSLILLGIGKINIQNDKIKLIKSDKFSISSSRPIILETDGETQVTRSACFEIRKSFFQFAN